MNDDKTTTGREPSMKRFLSFDSRGIGACADARHAARRAEDAVDPNAKQGGAITVTYKDDVATLDPAIGYDWQNWSMIKSLFDAADGLRAGHDRTSCPTSPRATTISPDGMTFTFKLRHGVKFHNGREMTADDVKYSLDRVDQPEDAKPRRRLLQLDQGLSTTSPAARPRRLAGITRRRSLDGQVRAAPARRHLPACHGAQLRRMSCRRRRSRSTAPISASIRSAPAPSSSTEWTLGQRIVFERNPDYCVKGAAASRQDHLRDRPGAARGAAAPAEGRGRRRRRRHSAGEVPGGDERSRAEGQLIVDGGQLHTGYVTMNTKMKPFDDVKVRQAVNMAINKDRIVQIINGRAMPANQPLPPSMPGYDKDFKGYAYDVDKAKALLAEAGYRRRLRDRALRHATPTRNPRIAQAIQQDLAAIGIKASIKSLAQANVIAAGGTEGRRADDLVGRHGLDRRLPGSVQLLRPDPRLRRRGRRAAGTGPGTATRTSTQARPRPPIR